MTAHRLIYVHGCLLYTSGFCAVCTTEQIAAQDFILTPGRYVGIAEDEGDGVPFEEKMTNLTGELKQLFEERKKQEEEIRLQPFISALEVSLST